MTFPAGTSLVIGAGSGIGEAVAQGLAAFGARVTCADVNLEAAERVADGIGEAIELDITDAEQVSEVIGEMAGLEILVSTPSINVRKPLLDYTEAEFERVVSLNLKGSFLALQAAGKQMAAQGRGSIVLFSSLSAHRSSNRVRASTRRRRPGRSNSSRRSRPSWGRWACGRTLSRRGSSKRR